MILAGAAGAIAGDNISYGIGNWVGEKTVKRWFRSEKSAKRLDWAERTLDERGAYIIILGRFIPGGRTAVTFSAGYLPTFPWRRFIVYDVIAGLTGATYGALLGYFGGKTFEENPLWGVLLALGIALSLGFLVEAVRHYRQRRRSRLSPSSRPRPSARRAARDQDDQREEAVEAVDRVALLLGVAEEASCATTGPGSRPRARPASSFPSTRRALR